MDFSSALIAMRMGLSVRRLCYQEDQKVVLVSDPNSPLQEHFELHTGLGKGWVWVPTTQDLLASDWVRVKPPTQGVVAEGFEAFGAMGGA